MRLRVVLCAFLLIGAVVALRTADEREVNLALMTAHAYASLGPGAGARCLHEPLYEYDPRHEKPDRAFLLEYPEDAAVAYVRQLSGVTGVQPVAERVVVNLRGLSSTVWVRAPRSGDPAGTWTLRLAPSGASVVSVDLPSVELMICNRDHEGWQVLSYD